MAKKKQKKNTKEEVKMILDHDPVPPYKTVFYITISIATAYLAVIFYMGYAAGFTTGAH